MQGEKILYTDVRSLKTYTVLHMKPSLIGKLLGLITLEAFKVLFEHQPPVILST
jgi:hypothetical protein